MIWSLCLVKDLKLLDLQEILVLLSEKRVLELLLRYTKPLVKIFTYSSCNNINSQMPSGREINVDEKCVAVVGKISVGDHVLTRRSVKRMREYGIRPKSGKLNTCPLVAIT